MDLGLRPLPGPTARRRSSIPFRAVWVVASAAPRRRSRRGDAEGDLYISTDATPAGKQAECAHQTKGSDQFKACSHSARDWWSVNGSYDFTLCAPRSAPGRRPRSSITVVDQGSSRRGGRAVDGGQGRLRRRRPQRRRSRTASASSSRKQVFVGWSKPAPKVDHLRLHFDRLLVRRAMDPELRARQAGVPARNESTLLGQIASGARRVAAALERRRHLGPLARDARREGRLGRSTGRQSVDFFVERGKPWSLVTLARECDFGALPGWDGPGHPTAPCPLTTEIGNSKGDDYPGAIAVTYRGAGARAPRHERLDGRLVLPAVEHARVLSADVHGYARALTGERNPHGQEPALPTRLAR